MNCGKMRDINETIWTVLTSFGFKEYEEPTGDKYSIFDKKSVVYVNKSGTAKAEADAVAAAIEASIANGLENFEVVTGKKEVVDLLNIFGFENMIKKDESEKGFCLKCGDTEFARGKFEKNMSECVIDTEKFYRALEDDGLDMSENDVSASLIFAEEGAEGIAYDIACSLRINGCIVEFYNYDGNIEEAGEYAEKKNMSCILRAYPDGKLMMKDMIKNEITETTAQDFLGYYDEAAECGCEDEDCGHEHGHAHHGDGCDCGCC